MKLKALQDSIQMAIVNGKTKNIEVIVVSNQLSAETRIQTYQNSAQGKPRSVLREDFQVVRSFVGEEDFEVLITKYLERYPANTHYINECGRYFPEYLQSLSLNKKPAFLVELARAEWDRVVSFFNFYDYKNEEILLSEGDLRVNPSLIVKDYQWPIHKIWDTEEEQPKGPTKVFIWTTEDRSVHVDSWSGVELEVLESLLIQKNLHKTIEVIQHTHSTSMLSDIFAKVLPQWIQIGLFEVNLKP